MEHETTRRRYPSDLTDREWEQLRPLLPGRPTGPGRPRTVDLRAVVDGVRYVLRTGCGGDYVPHDLPHRSTVRYYFDVWTRDGTLARVNAALRERVRLQAGREAQPSAGLLDSQTVKTTEVGGVRGFDGGGKNQRAQAAYPGGHHGLAAGRAGDHGGITGR
jgi:putative transposase